MRIRLPCVTLATRVFSGSEEKETGVDFLVLIVLSRNRCVCPSDIHSGCDYANPACPKPCGPVSPTTGDRVTGSLV